jgi:hypothetical protein
MSVGVPDGAYLVQFHRADRTVQRLIALDDLHPEAQVVLKEEDAPPVFTFAPLAHVRPASEVHHQEFVRRLCAGPVPSVNERQGSLILAVRRFDEGTEPGPDERVTRVEIRRNADNHLVAELSPSDADLSTGIWGIRLDVTKGAYRVGVAMRDSGRDAADDDGVKRIERIVYVCAGWQTLIFLPTRQRPDGTLTPDMARMSLFIIKDAFSPERMDLRWTENALWAISVADSVPSEWLPPEIWRAHDNPMLAICAALLHLRRETIDREMMAALLEYLRSTVGEIPDVVAIECGMVAKGSLPRPAAGSRSELATPPMLFESWRHLLRHSIDQPDMFPPRSLSNAVGETLIGAGPWLTWIASDTPPDDVLGVFWEWPQRSFRQLADIANRQLTTVLAALNGLQDAARDNHLRHFTRAQWHVALTVWPLLDPLMRSVVGHADPSEEDLADRSYLESAVDLINGTRSHAGHAFRAAWTLLLTLVSHDDFSRFAPDVFEAMRALPERDMVCLMPPILSNWPTAASQYRLAAAKSVGSLARSNEKPLLADMAHGLVESTHDQMQKLKLAVAGIDVLTETVPDRSATPTVHDAFAVLWKTYSQSGDIFEQEVSPHSLQGTFDTVFGPGADINLPVVAIPRLKPSAPGTVTLMVNGQFPVRLQRSALGEMSTEFRLLTAFQAARF